MKGKRAFRVTLFLFILLVTIMGSNPIDAKADTLNVTLDETIGWLDSIIGKAVDVDKVYGAQCVDLILFYYDYLIGGHGGVSGNANTYSTNYVPSGFTRIKGAERQPGDICISTSGEYGHVWIQGVGGYTYHQNYNYIQSVQKVSNYKDSGYWGVIRPTFHETAGYWLDLNWLLDGSEVITSYFGTADVYINGKLDEANSVDYYKYWPAGTTYEFKNIKAKDGYDYIGVSGNAKGTVNSDVKTYFKFQTKKATQSVDSSTWVKKDSGTYYYSELPSGFDTGHALYKKYNGTKMTSKETSTEKTVVESPIQTGWIYYHWTSNMYARANGNYNVFINQYYTWEGSREYYNFRAFESTNDHGHTDKNGIYGGDDVYYSWGDNPEDGSWWWFRVPLYSQKWTSYTKKTAQTIEVSGISLNKTSLSLVTGGTEALSATVTPSNATNKTITWSSSNTSVATVSNGKVTAVGAGTATITAKAGSKSATCSVTIKNPIVEVSGISLNSVSILLAPGETETLTATVTPSNATNKTIIWSSSNTKVATISNGKVTAVAVGTATITAKSGSKSVTCSVTVYNPTVEVLSVAINKTSLSMFLGDTESLSATITPANATNKTISWSSSNPAIATVDAKGKITAVAAGTATITAKAGNKSATCYVTVSDPTVNVTSIVLSNSELSLTVGDSEYLYATVYPSNASDKDVTWWSSDFSVAGVEDGYITAYSAGTAVITAQAGSKIGYCTVTVRDDNNVELVPEKHKIVVTNGMASMYEAKKGTTVYVTATIPEEGMKFAFWSVLGIDNIDRSKFSTSFVMGDVDVRLEAVYKIEDETDDEDYDDYDEDNDDEDYDDEDQISISDYEVSLSKTKYTYTGKEIRPDVMIEDLFEGMDYEVEYSDNISIGTATVTVYGIGEYCDEIEVEFSIVPKGTSISKLSATSSSVKVTYKKQTSKTSGYQVQVAKDSKFTKSVQSKTVSKNTITSATISKLKSKTTYYVRVRTYKTVNGKKVYSSWSKSKSIKTK